MNNWDRINSLKFTRNAMRRYARVTCISEELSCVDIKDL